ncbi:MAG: PHP domain-containing protein, partial [Clostridia bacterium]|nr:PHP domain-containing protein [Clostridia bacterium]
MKKFVHLHVHTEYSLLDGATKIKDLVAEVAKRGDGAVAITDHGNMYGVLNFYGECLKHKIKPIIGCEFYICHDLTRRDNKSDQAHLILLAKNNVGYHNLLKLSSIAWVDGFYYKPRIDYDALEKHSEGLICLSACLAGHIPTLIVEKRFDEAQEHILRLKSMFGEDFYLEVQDHQIPEQREVNVKLIEYSKKFGIKLVATNDVHYLNKE